MRAVGLMKHGGPEVLEVIDVPEVHTGPGEVRFRVHAAAVNPTDILARDGSGAEQQKVDPPPYCPAWMWPVSSMRWARAFKPACALATR